MRIKKNLRFINTEKKNWTCVRKTRRIGERTVCSYTLVDWTLSTADVLIKDHKMVIDFDCYSDHIPISFVAEIKHDKKCNKIQYNYYERKLIMWILKKSLKREYNKLIVRQTKNNYLEVKMHNNK